MYKNCCFTLIGNEILTVWEENKPWNMARIYKPIDIECVMDYSNMTTEQTKFMLDGGTVTAGLYETVVDVLFYPEKEWVGIHGTE